jgi:hypothetical protein
MSDLLLNTQYGELIARVPHYSMYDLIVRVPGEVGEIEFCAPDLNDVDELQQGCHGYVRLSFDEPGELRGLANAAQFVADITDLINEANAGAVEQAEERAAREREEAEKKQAERDALVRHRTDRLLNELIGETVRIRMRGYKSMSRAVVGAREKMEWAVGGYEGTGEYEPTFDWIDGDRGANVEKMMRLDLQTGAKTFQTLWDDGKDDLPIYDQGRVAKSKPYDASQEKV